MQRLSFLFLLFGLFLAAGCSSKVATNPVTGKVVLDGQPVTEGELTFTPQDPKGRPAGARIQAGTYSVELADGTYTVKVNATKKVAVSPGEPTASGEKEKLVSIIPPQYSENSQLTITVQGPTQKDILMATR